MLMGEVGVKCFGDGRRGQRPRNAGGLHILEKKQKEGNAFSSRSSRRGAVLLTP